MTDTTNTEPPLLPAPKITHPDAFPFCYYTAAQCEAYGDARAAHAVAQIKGEPVEWQPIKTAPRDGRNLLLRFGSDGVSQGKYVPGTPYPWKFIDTNDGVTWLVNHAVDGPGGPSHWMQMPSMKLTAPATTEQPSERCTEGPAALIGFADEEIQIPQAERRRVTVRAATAPAPVTEAREITDAEIDAVVPEHVPMDRFENAIREVGVVAACEWFGHSADSEFTKLTIRVLDERAAIALANGRD